MKPLIFSASAPDMRPDDPVHCLWGVVYKNFDPATGLTALWGSNGVRCDVHETLEIAQNRASTLHKAGYFVLAIVPVMYQDGDYIENFDPNLPEKRKAEEKARAKEIAEKYYYQAGDINRLINPAANTLMEFNRGLRGLMNFEPEPVKVKEGDGIKAAVEAKKAKAKPFHAAIAEGFRRSAGLRTQVNARHSPPSGKGKR